MVALRLATVKAASGRTEEALARHPRVVAWARVARPRGAIRPRRESSFSRRSDDAIICTRSHRDAHSDLAGGASLPLSAYTNRRRSVAELRLSQIAPLVHVVWSILAPRTWR